MQRLIAVLALALFAFPASALAMPADPQGWPSPRDDLRAIDQRTPQQSLPAYPTPRKDVAAPGQQAPTESPAPAPAPADGGFDWGDAVIGAAAAACLLALVLAMGTALRRRRHTSPVAG